MNLFSRSPAERPGRRRGLAGRLALSVGLLLPLASFSAFAAAALGASPASASISPIEAGGSTYFPVTPTRVADTRIGLGGNTLSNGATMTVQVAGVGDHVPIGATAVVMNITAIDPSASGYLTAYAAGQTTPFASTVNFIAGQTIANEATITLGAYNGGTHTFTEPRDVTIYNYGGTTDVTIDVQGYYLNANDSDAVDGAEYFPISYQNPLTGTLDNAPVRVLDTRTGSGQQGSGDTLGPNSSLSFYPGTANFSKFANSLVPDDATAVVLNLTEADATAASYLTLYAHGTPEPLASDLNFLATSGPVANRVIVPYNAKTQQISVYNWAGSTDVVADLDGYFASAVDDLEPTQCPPTGYTDTAVITVSPNDGTHSFFLTYGGNTDTPIVDNAGSAAVTGDLEGLLVPNPTVGFAVSGGNDVYTITWDSASPITGGANTGTTFSETYPNSGFLNPTGVTAIYSAACPGYYPGSFYDGLIAPHRIADTRALSGEPYEGVPAALSGVATGLGPFSILDIQVLPDGWGPATIPAYYAPSDFSGVDVNVTVTDTTASSYLELFPGQGGIGLGTTQLNGHPTSDINWLPGEIISNGDLLATVADFPSTSVDAFNWAGTVDVVVDVYGYFFIPS
jgi:hypothetical protein